MSIVTDGEGTAWESCVCVCVCARVFVGVVSIVLVSGDF
jgi:hypothetical protein